MKYIKFQDKNGSFSIENPENYSGLYIPLAGENGLKSAITPSLGGDSKLDQNHFLLEPVSIENLHNNRNTRNFWCKIKGKGYWSACGVSAEQEFQKYTDKQDKSSLEAGFMWQKLHRASEKYGLQSEILSFVTVKGDTEVHLVKITNIEEEEQEITPVAVIPVYGRSADNLRDHRHVTSLLHRIRTTEYGVEVKPVLSFDERGHQKNNTAYFVYGSEGEGTEPESFYPDVEMFIGEGGSFLIPEVVREEKKGVPAGTEIEGKEAVGGIRFASRVLRPHETAVYIVTAGISERNQLPEETARFYRTEKQVAREFEHVKKHWTEKVNVSFETGDEDRDNYLKWICFQPILRRIYGCSFLPYHDYGKGGRGWRDLWQDCLALLIMEPSVVRQMIVDNYGGVRIDGTNATIIGNRQGEFIADRNNIARVWMDHAFWPFVTTQLYMDQTGDMNVLFEKIPYFKDLQTKRGTAHDEKWSSAYGENQKTESGEVYYGTVLEHILLENLCAFYDVGEHNEMKLHGADWNDAMDMAWENGESVAFTCAYAGNMKNIAEYLRKLQEKEMFDRIEVAEEMEILFTGDRELYESPEKKQQLLRQYTEKCAHDISGNTIVIRLDQLSRNLDEKADWMMENIRRREWVKDGENGWFNGYYDDHKRPVERAENSQVRMMLTSQVFAIMSKTAQKDQIESICKSADKYLFDRQAGGYRLNTNFHEEKFDLGRMFGFAYGEKENGAVFSHMAVMYGNALYKNGYAKEGYKVLETLLDAAMDFENSRMYPGIPEYFDNQGRGLYAYLTGAASWYMLTMITEVFGVRGDLGDLVIAPALMPKQYNENGQASLTMEFAGRKLEICICNPEKKLPSEYKIKTVWCDEKEMKNKQSTCVRIDRELLEKLSVKETHRIKVELM